MGIDGLNPFIKKYSPDALFTMALTKLSGKKIAIDANYWMYANLLIARQTIIGKTDVTVEEPDHHDITKEFLLKLISFILKWVNNNITPIFVFDGKNKPNEKSEVRQERNQEAKEKKDKIDLLYEQINSDILANSSELINSLRKELSSYNPFDKDMMDSFKSLLQSIGIPWLQADGDGEKLCASLCIEGKVAAAYSKDTDLLAYGCPLVIYGFTKGYHKDEFGQSITMLDCVRLDKVLEGLDISYQSFIDLCIMCGCDYNNHTHMPKYAAISSYKLLKPYKLINKIPKSNKYDVNCLNYKSCREIFKFSPSEFLIVEKYNIINNDDNNTNELEINLLAFKYSRDYLDIVGISDQLDKIYGTFQKFSGSSPGLIDELQLKPINLNFTYNRPLRLVIVDDDKL